MISFIICTYNREEYIYRTLCYLAEQYDSHFEIILVDNRSTDSTAQLCQQFAAEHPNVPYHYFLEEQQGLSFARNRGIQEAQGDMLVFLDDDAFVQQDYVKNLQAYLTDYPDLQAFGGKIDPMYESGKEPEWMSKWAYTWVSAIDYAPQMCPFRDNAYPIGANMGIRKELALRCGGFNTELGRTGKNLMAGEEKDLWTKVRALGHVIYYLPEVAVRHCIPEKRTTRDYIIRMAEGVGMSERVRTLGQSKQKYLLRICTEGIKWGGTIVLWCRYMLEGTPAKANALVLFRKHVTHGLLAQND